MPLIRGEPHHGAWGSSGDVCAYSLASHHGARTGAYGRPRSSSASQPSHRVTGRSARRWPSVDLTLTESEAAFRDEVRSWLEENHPGPAPEGDDQAEFEFRRAWQKKMHEAGWAGHLLARGVRRQGRHADRAVDLQRGARPPAGAAPGQRARPGDGRPRGDRARHATTRRSATWSRSSPARRSGARASREPESGSDLASLKTPRRQVERRLEGHRPEGLDHLRARGEVLHAARPHRPGRPQAQGHHLLHPRHGPARTSTSGRCARSPARPSSTRSSWRRPRSPTRTSSARSAAAGGSRSRR